VARAPHLVVDGLEDRLRPLETDFRRAYWSSQVAATPAHERRRAELELAVSRVKGDPDALIDVRAALDEGVHDPVLRRQLEVLRRSLSAHQMSESQRERIVGLSSSIESDFASHRPEVDGRPLSENDVDDVLRHSDDTAERRAVWEASKEIGAVVAGRVRELVRARNEVARELGYADFYGMALDLQEIDEEWLFELFGALDALTEQPFAAWKSDLDRALRRRFGVDDLGPWHYADPFFQTLPSDGGLSLEGLFAGASARDLALDTFARWGFDLAGVMDRSDLFPRADKSQHAFCLDIDRAGDVRILANIAPGERWVETMLHESGHAAYDVSIADDVPYLLHRPAHTFVTEAVAMLSGRLLRDAAWMTEIAGIPGVEVDAIAPRIGRASASQLLVFTRWVLVVTHFERSLYGDPEGDLDARWWELVERFQGVDAPDRGVPGWAAKIHVSTAPAYYHNYLLGEMLAAQLRAALERDAGGLVGAPEAGRFLVERLCRSGALVSWPALVEAATGRPLGAQDLAGFLARAEPGGG
jgi:peptidyl-dipeptidase A